MNEISDWERGSDCHGQWKRRSADGDDVYVNDNAERGVFRSLVRGTLLGGTFTCPDAAREAADAYLVNQGRLDKSRAFVRLGEWADGAASRWVRHAASPASMAFAINDLDRAREDAELVASGALDPSRAFKAGPVVPSVNGGPLLLTGSTGGVWGVMSPWPQMHNSVPPEVARATKPAWGEWERIGIAFVRRPSDRGAVPIAAYVDRWELGGAEQANATDIDDAREKADAFLVARGELEAGRAFKRVGDWTTTMPIGDGHDRLWEAQGVCVRMRDGKVVAGVARGVVTDGFYAHSYASSVSGALATSKDAQQLADAELVRRGLLAEERAFKVAQQKPKPLAWDVGGGVTAVTGLAFGDAVPNTAVGIDYASAHGNTTTAVVVNNGNTTTAVVVNKRADGVSEVVGYAQDITKMPDDEINAMYGKHSEVARAMIGAKRRETRTVVHAVTNHGGAVTLATWEHHLPTLLDNAPREFRDGFNRRQGPAWEAYLRGLAGVREEIQCRKLRGSPGVTEVVLMATTKAHIILGPYWIDANVVGKR